MKEKANAWGNSQDRGSTRWLDKGRKPPRPPPSKFAPLAKATADFLWVIYEIDSVIGIEPNDKLDTQQSKWTRGTTN